MFVYAMRPKSKKIKYKHVKRVILLEMREMNELAVMFVCRRSTAILWRVVIDNQRVNLGFADGVLPLEALYIPTMDVLERGQDVIARCLRYLDVFINEHASMYSVLERAKPSMR